ncbi:O-antigen ligase family protein [Ferribacterium limneticum]|uniref:O-antigen ligase family protein n=1 Tax=Ferribacterium limneticum TaxID=76259 RepID=UPI001CF8BFE7|nr:O-antigen ligase family protein [Ferribacterium limneticum]UCV24658.1 O-antigen ligase family protein [Ferribacterium limneticum]
MYFMLPIVIIVEIVFALILGFFAVRVIQLANSADRRSAFLILSLLILGSAMSIFISGRVLVSEALFSSLEQTTSMYGELFGRASNYALIGVSLIVLAKNFHLTYKNIDIYGKFIFCAFFLYSIFSPLMAGLFGTQPRLIFSFFVAPLVFSALVSLGGLDTKYFIEKLKLTLGVVIGFSLGLIAVFPSLVIEPYGISHIPGFPYRFWGLTLHANSMGPLAFLLLFSELIFPGKNKFVRYMLLVTAVMAFVLAQSKTAWVAGMVALAVIVSMEKMDFQNKENGGRAIVNLLFAMVVVSILIWFGIQYLDSMQRLFGAKEFGGGDFSGRPIIWKLAFSEWMSNIIFGYGPFIWTPEYRIAHNMNFAFHAHSQFFQIIGESGAIGLVSLLIYIGALFFASVRASGPVKRFLIGYLIFVLIRSISEPTFRMLNPTGGDVLIHLPLFVMAVLSLKELPGGNYFYTKNNTNNILFNR